MLKTFGLQYLDRVTHTYLTVFESWKLAEFISGHKVTQFAKCSSSVSLQRLARPFSRSNILGSTPKVHEKILKLLWFKIWTGMLYFQSHFQKFQKKLNIFKKKKFSKAGNLLNSFPGTKLHNLPSVQAQSAFKVWIDLFQGDSPHKYQSSIGFAKVGYHFYCSLGYIFGHVPGSLLFCVTDATSVNVSRL
ncbi:uncharacterized protein EV154DRAFT_489056 [Mucor mucedo]|uniref:uncharacterized protein n=1 Tax=Mucor mucedo TaxID=29922 RepID=UPI0022210A2E|nr:uncharacterized protein EV154DRAFT_489056 [Mucor mucedo]KAI7863551.1 hypothetical protein EV154DRAFT_489056 [Mucor mucedo]